MPADIVLKVKGRQYDGWESARITRGIEAIAGGFELSVSERWANNDVPWPIVEEDECSLLVNGQTLITGYVDKRSLRFGSEEHSIGITGRDKAGALVDCSAVLGTWEFNGLPILALVQKLCTPFGIKVTMDPGLNAKAVQLKVGKGGGAVSGAGKGGKRSGLGVPHNPGKFSVDPGESAFEVIDRACRMTGILPISDGLGGVVLTRAGSGRTADSLVQGVNVLSASADFDAATRYYKYIVSAQRQGTDEDSGESVASVTGSALDPNVRRKDRVLIVRPEASATSASAKVRAGWEAKVRAGRADSMSVTVVGWNQSDGTLWPVNALVGIDIPYIGIKGDLLITQTTFEVSSSGLTTVLTLRRPDAFLPEPTIQSDSGLWKEISHGV